MIETLLFWILVALTVLFAFIHLFVWRGLKNLIHGKSDEFHSFSIIVAARNEEKHIARLLDSLLQLDYPKEKFEIVIVDDRSTDSTRSVVDKFVSRLPNLKVLSIVNNDTDMPHKKNALRTGISNARFDILAFTDADCVVTKQWLKRLSEQFTDDVGIVAGYSPFEFSNQNEIFNSFLRYEELQGSVSAAAAIGIDNAFLCTGRNLAYRKKVYVEVNGFEKIKQSVSGDDDLFIQLVRRETSWKTRYMAAADSYVMTVPPGTVKEFINQRARHLSASKYYSLRMKIVFGLLHAQLLAALIVLFVLPLFGLIFVLIRINIDALSIVRGKELFNEEFSVVEFFRNELLLILYVIILGPLGFLKKYDWKGTAT